MTYECASSEIYEYVRGTCTCTCVYVVLYPSIYFTRKKISKFYFLNPFLYFSMFSIKIICALVIRKTKPLLCAFVELVSRANKQTLLCLPVNILKVFYLYQNVSTLKL